MDDDLYNHLLAMASEEKRRRIEKFIHKADAYRTLLADAIVRRQLAEWLQLDAAAITFSSNAYGKPFAVQATGLHFNTTHSERWVAAVFNENPCGIDVEHIKSSDPLALAKRYFSRLEYEAIQTSREQVKAFYTYWSMKESYIKALGLGLSKELASFSVHIGDDGSAAVEDMGKLSGYRIYPLKLDNEYASAVCLQEGCQMGEVCILDPLEWLSVCN